MNLVLHVVITHLTFCFQKVVGDRVVNQLDKSVSAKLEATVARQIQMQFHTSVKQTLLVFTLCSFIFIDGCQAAVEHNITLPLGGFLCLD